jgi:hypothetical protein
MNPYATELLAQERMRDRLREADNERLARIARRSRTHEQAPGTRLRGLLARLAPAGVRLGRPGLAER